MGRRIGTDPPPVVAEEAARDFGRLRRLLAAHDPGTPAEAVSAAIRREAIEIEGRTDDPVAQLAELRDYLEAAGLGRAAAGHLASLRRADETRGVTT